MNEPAKFEPAKFEPAKLELEQRVKLYEMYVGIYTRGIVIFLAIDAAMLKFALDVGSNRTVFAIAALICSFAILIPLILGIRTDKSLATHFNRLAIKTGTFPIDSTRPLRILWGTALIFWFINFIGWLYIGFVMDGYKPINYVPTVQDACLAIAGYSRLG